MVLGFQKKRKKKKTPEAIEAERKAREEEERKLREKKESNQVKPEVITPEKPKEEVKQVPTLPPAQLERIENEKKTGLNFMREREKKVGALVRSGLTEKQAREQFAAGTAETQFQEQQSAKLAAGQAEFRPGDVEQLQSDVAAEQETLAPSEIQQFQELRKKEFSKQDEFQISRIVLDFDVDREEAEAMLNLIPVEDRIKLTPTRKANALMEGIFGDVGKDLVGVSLNQITDTLRNKESMSAITGTLSEMASKLPAVEGMVNNGAITPQRALAKLNEAQKDIDIMDANIQRAGILSPDIILSSEYRELREELDVLKDDLIDATGTALEKLRTGDTTFNLLETQAYVAELEGSLGKTKLE